MRSAGPWWLRSARVCGELEPVRTDVVFARRRQENAMNPEPRLLVTGTGLWLQSAGAHGVLGDAGKSYAEIAENWLGVRVRGRGRRPVPRAQRLIGLERSAHQPPSA